MRGSKLYDILAAFHPNEVSQLRLFVESPLFNNGKRPQKVNALLGYLLRFYPDFPDSGLEKEAIYEAVYPGERFVKNKLDKLNAELKTVVLKFIHWLQTDIYSRNQEAEYWMHLVQFFQERQMDQAFKNAVGQLERQQQANPFREYAYFFRQFKLEVEKLKFQARINDKKGDANLPAAIRALDQFYVLTKLEYCSYLLFQSTNTRLDTSTSTQLLDEVLSFVEKELLDVPAIAAFYYILPIMHPYYAKSTQPLEQLKKSLAGDKGKISHETLMTIHSHMRSSLSDRYNQGDTDVLNELFALFQDQIQQGTIYQDGYHILASTLQSAITVAIKLGEYDWALDFLSQHRDRINGVDDPVSLYNFNLANIYFHQGDYETTENLLHKFHYKEMFYNLAVRRLELKLIFETYKTDTDYFESKLKAFKSFLQNKKKELPADKFEPNNNFLNLLTQILTRIRDINSSEEKVEPLIDKLHRQKAIAEREWLLEKLKELLP